MNTTTHLDDYDFGFSAVSESELKTLERELQQQVTAKDSEIEQVTKTYEQKLNTLYKMIMPLLNNLSSDADKPYIYWPNRTEKLNDFIAQIDKLVGKK